LNLVDALAKSEMDNVRLRREVVAAQAEAQLARSSSNEWRDRYWSLRDPTGGQRADFEDVYGPANA